MVWIPMGHVYTTQLREAGGLGSSVAGSLCAYCPYHVPPDWLSVGKNNLNCSTEERDHYTVIYPDLRLQELSKELDLGVQSEPTNKQSPLSLNHGLVLRCQNKWKNSEKISSQS